MGRLTEWVGTDENRHAIPRTVIRKNGHQRCCNKLAHYEDLEEQGRLIEQKYGYWTKQQREAAWGMTTDNICSVCNEKCWLTYEYCPNCGAKMLTKEEAEAKLKELEG